jgi:uncharacterized protein (TIRG00374 family)
VLAGSILTSPLIAGLAARWQIFLRQQRLEFSLSTIFGLTWAGQFFNSLLPGSTGGDVVKIYQLCRMAPTRKPAVAATVVADRLAALVALLVLAGISFGIEPAPLRLLYRASVSLNVIIALCVFGFIGAVILWSLIRSAKWQARIARLLAACREALTLNRKLLAAVALAFAVHLLNFLIIYFFARSLHLTITYQQVLLIMPVVLFLVLLPVTINGHGLRELLLIAYFTFLGIRLRGGLSGGTQEIAVALSILIVANDLLWSLPGGIWYFVKFREAPATASTPLA